MSLANTNWNLTFIGQKSSNTIQFGENESKIGTSGGNGKFTMNGTQLDIMWIEDGNGRFMFQIKGPTGPTVYELPTYTGSYKGTVATGWYSNFDAIWGTTDFTMIVT